MRYILTLICITILGIPTYSPSAFAGSNDNAIMAVDFVYTNNAGADSIEDTITKVQGETLYAYIIAQDVVNLATYNCVIHFNPTVLTYANAYSEFAPSLKNIFNSAGGTLLSFQVDDSKKTQGEIILTASLAGTTGAPSGNGLLGILEFTIQTINETGISFGPTDNYFISTAGISDTSNPTDLRAGIVNRPMVELLSPLGGEALGGGSSHDIRWNASGQGVDHIRLLYSTNSGSTYPNTIVVSTEDDGTYAWTVPMLDLSTVRVKVIVEDSSNTVLAEDASDGDFMIDSTPPETSVALAGTQGENNWWTSDVTVTLEATDSVSGIKETRYKIDSDSWQTYSNPFTVSGSTVYYRSEDNAGNLENKKTIEIKIDRSSSSTPVVTDGGNYTVSSSQLHASWVSNDAQSSIAEYQYAIGTTKSGTDVVSWTSTGTNTSATATDLNLTNGQIYYFSVKAKNGAGLWSSVGISDGITVDNTPPSQPAVSDDGGYTTSTTELYASWTSTDEESGISEYQYAIGTTAGGADVVSWTSKGTDTSVTATGLNLTNGQTYYFSIKAKNGIELWSDVGISDGITVDNTPPSQPVVSDDGEYTTSTTQLHASWVSSDGQSGIAEYQYAIGKTAGETNVVSWTSTGTSTEVTVTGLSLTDGQTYYFSVKAKNGAGLWSAVGISDGITVDSTAPTTEISLAGTSGSNGWYTSKVTVTLSANDATSGVDFTRYRIDNGEWEIYSSPFEITTEGEYMVEYYSKDKAGNQESTKSETIKIDDDIEGPSFSNFHLTATHPKIPFHIQVDIIDPSGVYDDDTGSEGQGAYILYDNDGELENSAKEIQLDILSGNIYQTITEIPGQVAEANFVYQVCALDNDFDFMLVASKQDNQQVIFQRVSDRTKSCSDIQHPIFVDAGEDTFICHTNNGGESQLNATASGGTPDYTHSWTPTTGLDDATIANPKATPTETTTYIVTITDSKECQATDDVTVAVNPELTVDAGEDTFICHPNNDGESQLNATASGGTPDYIYSWTPTTGLDDATIANPKAIPTETTTYTVTITDSKGCQATDDVTVAVNPELTADAGEDEEFINPGETIQVGGNPTADGGMPDYTYSWTPIDTLDDAINSNPNATPTETTTYTVTVIDSKGCEDSDEITVTVNKRPGIASVTEDTNSETKTVDDVITVTVTQAGDGVTAVEGKFSIGDSILDKPLTKTEIERVYADVPVIWTGTYTVVKGDMVNQQPVTATLKSDKGLWTEPPVASETKVTIDTIAAIDEVTASPTTKIGIGGEITVTAIGEANAQVIFSISGVSNAQDVQMPESPAGNYTGVYIVQEGDDVKDATVTVTMTDALGNVDSLESTDKVTLDGIAPSKPTGLDAVAGESQVSLSWNANIESDLSRYNVYRSLQQGFEPTGADFVGKVDKPSTNFTDTDVKNGTTYYYRISAFDDVGNESESSVETSVKVPAPVISVTPEQIDFGTVILGEPSYKSVFISNSGDADLIVTNITSDINGLAISPTSFTIVSEAEAREVTLTLTSENEDEIDGTLTIESNDLDSPTLINISAKSLKECIEISTETGFAGSFLNGAVEIEIEQGAIGQDATLCVSPISIDNLPDFAEGITGFAPLNVNIPGSTVHAFILGFDPPVTLLKPLRITAEYNDDSIPKGPGEESFRMYRSDIDGDKLLPIIGEGFQPRLNENTLSIDYQGPTASSIFAVMSGYPYGDVDGDGFRTITDAVDMLNDLVETRYIFPEDRAFGMGVADLDYNPATTPAPERPTILDVGNFLSRFVENIPEFPVEENWRNYPDAPSLINPLPTLNVAREANLSFKTAGQNLTVSVNLDNNANVFGVELWLRYDATLLKIVDVSDSDCLTAYNDKQEGKLHIASMPLSNDSPLAKIQFELLPGADKSALSSIKLTKVKLNDGSIPIRINSIPQKSMLLQNYPNPFNPETWIPYRLNQVADVTIRIYDVNGHPVRLLHIGEQMPGHYVTKDKAACWNGLNEKGEKVSSGIYFYQFKANGKSFVKKMVILK